jgi:hypothetical protein
VCRQKNKIDDKTTEQMGKKKLSLSAEAEDFFRNLQNLPKASKDRTARAVASISVITAPLGE